MLLDLPEHHVRALKLDEERIRGLTLNSRDSLRAKVNNPANSRISWRV